METPHHHVLKKVKTDTCNELVNTTDFEDDVEADESFSSSENSNVENQNITEDGTKVSNIPPEVSSVKDELFIPDISDYCPPKQADDATKYQLILTRKPETGYVFPPRKYTDKRKKDGITFRRCNVEWFELFDFLSYSRAREGLFCLCCVLFPCDASLGPRAKGLITIPYTHWKDAKRDIYSHSYLGYHLESKAKMDCFIEKMQSSLIESLPVAAVNGSLASPEATTGSLGTFQDPVLRNRKFLECILKSVEVCGRQGFVSGLYRDGSATNDLITALLDVRIDSGDCALQEHLRLCQMTSTYTSKACQNDLLKCVKIHIQQLVIKQIKKQLLGPLFGLVLEDVPGVESTHYIGLVLRYVHENHPTERMVDFFCVEDKETNIGEFTRITLEKLGLEVRNCGSQSYDTNLFVSATMCPCASSEFQKTAGKLFTHVPRFHAGTKALTYSMCKTCCVSEVHFVLQVLKSVNEFFSKSRERRKFLEMALFNVNELRKISGKPEIPSSSAETFCVENWNDKHNCWDDLHELYEAVIQCLKLITMQGNQESMQQAWVLLTQISSSEFITTLQICRNVFGQIVTLSVLLNSGLFFVSTAYSNASQDVLKLLQQTKDNVAQEFQQVFRDILAMCNMAGTRLALFKCPLNENVETYLKKNVFTKLLNCIHKQLSLLFRDLPERPEGLAVYALHLIPTNLSMLTEEKLESMIKYFGKDLPLPATLSQEISLWKQQWAESMTLPATLEDTLKTISKEVYPNIFGILNILALTPVDQQAISHVAVKEGGHLDNVLLSTLSLLHINSDISLDYKEIIDMYAMKHPQRMFSVNPLSDKQIDLKQ